MALFLIQQSCTRVLNDILCHSVYISVADPDLQIRGGGGGGGGGGRAPAPDPPLHLTLFVERKCVTH